MVGPMEMAMNFLLALLGGWVRGGYGSGSNVDQEDPDARDDHYQRSRPRKTFQDTARKTLDRVGSSTVSGDLALSNILRDVSSKLPHSVERWERASRALRSVWLVLLPRLYPRPTLPPSGTRRK